MVFIAHTPVGHVWGIVGRQVSADQLKEVRLKSGSLELIVLPPDWDALSMKWMEAGLEGYQPGLSPKGSDGGGARDRLPENHFDGCS